MSQLHLDVVQHRLKRRFDLEIVTHAPRSPTVKRSWPTARACTATRNRAAAEVSSARCICGSIRCRATISSKEQFFADFAIKDKFEKIRVDHCHYDPDFNFGFIDTIVGGTIPNQYVPACEKGCKELLERGALAGYRIQDVAVEVYFGKQHDVDSSEAAFKTAARIAFRNAFNTARPVLLEPIVDLEVTVPSKYVGAILGDLNTKRARVENQDSLPGDLAVIKAKAPLAEVARYAAQLGSITQGQGSYTMEFSHYDMVPGNVQDQIVKSATKVASDEDE